MFTSAGCARKLRLTPSTLAISRPSAELDTDSRSRSKQEERILDTPSSASSPAREGRKHMTMRTALLAALLIPALSCGGATKVTPNASVSGAYEFAVTSNVTGGVTLIEANLAANGNQSGATGANQVQVLTFEQKNWYVNGICPGSTPGHNSVASNTSGNKISLTFDDGGNTF